jgi:hypothetical protein
MKIHIQFQISASRIYYSFRGSSSDFLKEASLHFNRFINEYYSTHATSGNIPCLSARSAEWKPSRLITVPTASPSSAKSVAM